MFGELIKLQELKEHIRDIRVYKDGTRIFIIIFTDDVYKTVEIYSVIKSIIKKIKVFVK